MQEASKARETRLRKAGIQGRARLASELRTMDNEVAAVSRALAVRTLQLEAEFVFAALEAEALDILVSLLLHLVHHLEQKQRLQYIIKLFIHALYLCRETQQPARQVGDRGLALGRRGSSDEVALLAAEFKLLDEQLAALVSEVESGRGFFH